MAREYWHNACRAAVDDITSAIESNSLFTSSGFVLAIITVSFGPKVAAVARNFILLQSSSLLVCASISLFMHIRWRRLDDYDRSCVWKHYGRFSGFMCAGCCFGSLSFAAWMQWLYNYYATDWSQTDSNTQSSRFAQVSCSTVSRMQRSVINLCSGVAVVSCIPSHGPSYRFVFGRHQAFGVGPLDGFFQAEIRQIFVALDSV